MATLLKSSRLSLLRGRPHMEHDVMSLTLASLHTRMHADGCMAMALLHDAVPPQLHDWLHTGTGTIWYRYCVLPWDMAIIFIFIFIHRHHNGQPAAGTTARSSVDSPTDPLACLSAPRDGHPTSVRRS